MKSVHTFIGAVLVTAVAGLAVLVAQTKVKTLPGLESSNFKDFDQITAAATTGSSQSGPRGYIAFALPKK